MCSNITETTVSNFVLNRRTDDYQFNAKPKASSTNNQNSCNTESNPLYIVTSVILKLEKN